MMMARASLGSPQRTAGPRLRRSRCVEQRVVGGHTSSAAGESVDQCLTAGVGHLVDTVPVREAEDEALGRPSGYPGVPRRPGSPAPPVHRSRCARLAARRDPPTSNQEVRVHGDAVPADADAWLMDVRVRLAIRSADHLEDVDAADALGLARELIGQRDVHVAVGRLGELRELRGLAVAQVPDLCSQGRCRRTQRPGSVLSGSTPPTSFGYVARSAKMRPLNTRSGLNASRSRASRHRRGGPLTARASDRTGRAYRRPGAWSHR